MTLDIAIVLAVLLAATVLFVTDWVRMDLVALMCLGAVALSGLVTPAEALAGFSNPAVITVWAMFMLSAGLTHTGVAGMIGRRVLGLAGRGEARMVFVIMLSAAALSSFMNNIGVAALMLPVVMDIARETGRPAARLLMPLAYGTLLGGLTTLVGTPPNLLVADALREHGLTPFGLFDFTPVGGSVMLAGILYVALVGRRVLPRRDPAENGAASEAGLRELYRLGERSVVMRLRADSVLVGKSLREARLGSAAGLNVLAVLRGAGTTRAPEPGFVLRAEDRLVVEGRLDRLGELQGWRELVIESPRPDIERIFEPRAGLAELRLAEGSELVGRTLRGLDFRRRFGVIVLAVRGGTEVRSDDLALARLRAGDRLLVLGARADIETLRGAAQFAGVETVSRSTLESAYGLAGRLFIVRIPGKSVLVGQRLDASRIGDAFGLGVLGLIREERTQLLPGPAEELQAGDRLLVRGGPEALDVLRGLQQLEVVEERPEILDRLESELTGLAEVVLAPRTRLVGKTLRDISFREKFGLRVLAIQREGRSMRSDLRDVALRFGDALLLFGARERLQMLGREPDFIVLTQAAQRVPRTSKAPSAGLIMVATIVSVFAGWLPISIAGVAGATLMVLAGCLTMDEAYQSVSWRSIFLIAGMLPLGAALQTSGGAAWLAGIGLAAFEPLGGWGLIAGLYAVTAMATMIIPTSALVVLMSPIAISSAGEMGVSPYTAMMAVAVAASASFASPISHPANVLVMGPGGYRFADYLKLGLPLTLAIMIVALILIPLVWPL